MLSRWAPRAAAASGYTAPIGANRSVSICGSEKPAGMMPTTVYVLPLSGRVCPIAAALPPMRSLQNAWLTTTARAAPA